MAGTEVYRGVRRVVVRGFPYVVLYLVESDLVIVIAVYHTSRDPDGWHERLT
jgi:plasmid stabilization system protein ParE